MIRRGTRARAGITLTEILISILIMGVGMVSLATLFPLGLLRLRNAARMSRSALFTATATGEAASRNLFNGSSFLLTDPLYATNDPLLYRTCPWYVTPFPFIPGTSSPDDRYDPWIQDIPAFALGVRWNNGVYRGRGGFGIGLSPSTQVNVVGGVEVGRIDGPGLVVAYDPLWRAVTGFYPNNFTLPEARFACGTDGTDALRDDPNPGGSNRASAHGLHRITNFADTPINNQIRIPSIFVSPDDVIFQSSDFLTFNNPNGDRSAGSASPVVPDMSSNGMVNDWRFTWMFTGRRNDAGDASVYSGDIVVFDSRPFAVDETTGDVAGERVVEAVFGYSRSVVDGTKGVVGYGAGADRTVLLRWRATELDPEIRVGSWIADVTYERVRAVSDQRTLDADNEGLTVELGSREYQRCHWYQVVKKSPAVDGPPFVGDDTRNMRSMTVIVNRPLQAKTLLFAGTGTNRGNPYHVNAALVSPYVVNVFPKSFTAR